MAGSLDFESTGAIATIRGEARKAVRFPMHSLVRAVWVDGRGAERNFPAQGLNLSATGAALVVAASIPLDTPVHLELLCSRMSGTARVRNCTRRGASWRAGVEFGEFLRRHVIARRTRRTEW